MDIYQILTGKYDASVSSSLATLRDKDSDTRGYNSKLDKKVPD